MRLAMTLLAVALVLPAAAQEITGTITGAVTDPSGAAIPGLTVNVRNLGTNATTSVITDDNGIYTATLLPVGRYEVSSSSPASRGSSVRTSSSASTTGWA